MRLFQNYGLYRSYRPRLAHLTRGCETFSRYLDSFLADRYGATHFLKPVLERDDDAFFTNGDDQIMQGLWAAERGMKPDATLPEVLRAQIEEHRTDVFYNIDPMRYGSDFVRSLPGCVRHVVAWRAAPSGNKDFSAYDALLCNFPSILRSYEEQGWTARYFAPAHDPAMDSFAAQEHRPIDVIFVGGYSRHHRQRSETLKSVAGLGDRFNIVFHLDVSRLSRLAERTIGRCLPLRRYRRPREIRRLAREPIFGLELYGQLSRAKIVLNGAVDMAGQDRGNMRCFEAMGCGALLMTDHGRYPDGMTDGESILTYSDSAQVAGMVEQILGDTERMREISANGYRKVSSLYSKEKQWAEFKRIVEAL